jgi:hypothetical protein
MFKATHKGRVTTLSKTLLTASLLGGAALSSLGAGSAQAACLSTDTVSLTWAQWIGGTPLTCRDKKFTWVTAPTDDFGDLGDPATTVSAVMPLDGDYIFNLDKPFTAVPFDFTYEATITAAGWVFSKIDLDSDADTFANPPSVLTATYTPNVGPAMILTSTNGSASIEPVPYGPTIITVNNKYMPPNGGAIDTLQNSFQQVPAPLPLLGVGAVFGSIRKLRKFSSQLKTFSMG